MALPASPGLANVKSQELVQFANGVMGIAFNLEKDAVGVIIMGEYSGIAEGMSVRATGRIASVPVGDGLDRARGQCPGRAGGRQGPDHRPAGYRPIERIAAGVVQRQDVDTPVQTGIKAIDSMIPIGRGQRELIIGDRQTGKTAIAIDTIINQKGKDLVCIYVAIGQKKAAVARTVALLERHGAMDHTIVVIAAADESAALQYIAPYAGCAIGEEFMETGRDALVIYDDLSKHAWAYRQVSLLLRRPPGREAYPGDIFYLHSRLLERASRLANKYIIVKKDFKESLAVEKDSVDGHVFTGPRSGHDAGAGSQSPEGPRRPQDRKTGRFRRLPDGPADHRDPAERCFGLYPHQRHLHHRWADLPGQQPVQRRHPPGGGRGHFGLARGRFGPGESHAPGGWQAAHGHGCLP